MGKKLSNKEWEEHINQYYSCNSSITINEFCRENNLSKQQFYYHKKRILEVESNLKLDPFEKHYQAQSSIPRKGVVTNYKGTIIKSTRSYRYDVLNQMIGTTTSARFEITYGYNGEGKRIL